MAMETKSNVVGLAALTVSSIALGGVMAAALAWAGRNNNEISNRRRARRHEQHHDGDHRAEHDDDDRRPRSETRSSLETRQSTTVGHTRSSNRFSDRAPVEDEEISCGFSMAEAMQQNTAAYDRVKDLTPNEVLANLQKGNARFWTGSARRPEQSAFHRRALISKQFPTVAILGCSDSRVPIEIVFDQGLGDIFVIRVAGNCLRLPNAPPPVDPTYLADSATLASLQYAVNHLKVKVVIVMGHEGCGAVKAAQLPTEAIGKEPEYLRNLLTGLRSGLNLDRLHKIKDAKAYDREAVVTNVKRQVEWLVEDSSIMEKVSEGEVLLVGAFYEISSGIVDFFHEVSEESGPQVPTSPVNRSMERRPSRGVLTRLNLDPKSRLRLNSDEVS